MSTCYQYRIFICSTLWMTVSVMFSSVQLNQCIIFTVASESNFYPPFMLPDGPRPTTPKVQAFLEFRGLVNSCTCVYTPNSILHCTSKLMVKPVMMVVRLRLPLTPELTEKLLSQNIEKFIILIILLSGIFLNGRVCLTVRVSSYTTLICNSFSGMCSSTALILKYTLGK